MLAAPFIPITRAPHGHELQAALAYVPAPWRGRVAKTHAKKTAADLKPGNQWLADTIARLVAIKVPVTTSDADLCAKARELAEACMGLSEIAPQGGAPSFNDNGALFAARSRAAPRFYLTDLGTIRRRMGAYLSGFGITPPRDDRRTDQATGETVQKGVEDAPAVRRMTDHLWIRRQLRKAQCRALEAEAIRLGYVHKRGEIYASDHTTHRRQQQKARNADSLAGTIARNTETGDEFTLQELAARSVANPAIRRGELMTRLAGFEACAKALGHVGLFITLTCPSRMHAKKSTRPAPGRPVQTFDNPKFDGTTPREAQGYLCQVWSRTRAALARVGARCYGFRIAEPHHDGAPHWHLLLFVAAELKEQLCRIFARHACKEDADELASKDARRARFLVKAIDPAKGSAAGYVAKYVSKNIDGYQVQRDFEGAGRDAISTAPRVDAWAAAWGIRQFQQIGGAPVGLWRELRRIPKEDAAICGDAMAAAYAAVNKTEEHKADFGAYVAAMGGPLVKRKDMPLELAKTDRGTKWHREAGQALPCPLNRYGEETPPAVFGVREVGRRGRLFVSRRYTWEIKRNTHGGPSGPTTGHARGAARADRGNVQEGFVVGRPAQPAGPWSPVNNCTRGGFEDGRFSETGGADRAAHRGGFVATARSDAVAVGDSPAVEGSGIPDH